MTLLKNYPRKESFLTKSPLQKNTRRTVKKNFIWKINYKKKEINQLITKSKVKSKLDILIEGQTKNSKQLEAIQNDLEKRFIVLSLLNEKLLKSNEQLKEQLDEVFQELNVIKKELEEKAARKGAGVNRKHLPKRYSITIKICKLLIK